MRGRLVSQVTKEAIGYVMHRQLQIKKRLPGFSIQVLLKLSSFILPDPRLKECPHECSHTLTVSFRGSLPNREEPRKCAGLSCCTSSLVMPGGSQPGLVKVPTCIPVQT